MSVLIDADGLAQMMDVAAIDEYKATGELGWHSYLFHAGNARLLDAPTPRPWQAGCWRWDEGLERFVLEALPERFVLELLERIDALRDERIAQGKRHLFPDGQAGTVQLRNERDISNVNALATAGSALVMAGSEELLGFRDEGDVTHPLTGEQAVQLGLAVMQWVSGHYAAAWAHKDAIRALAEASDLEALQDYGLDSGWPQAEEARS